MKAVFINNHGDINTLNWGEIANPEKIRENQVLVEIKASSINHLDLWVRRGLIGHKIKMPFILGSDGAGVIVEKGKKIKNYEITDNVVIQPGIFNKKTFSLKNGHHSKGYKIIGESVNGVQSEYFRCNIENI